MHVFFNERAQDVPIFIDKGEIYKSAPGTEKTFVLQLHLRSSQKDRKVLCSRSDPSERLTFYLRCCGRWCSLSAVEDSVVSLFPNLLDNKENE
jgi:hypothetical protein